MVLVVLASGAQVKSRTLAALICSCETVAWVVVVEPDCCKSSFMILILK